MIISHQYKFIFLKTEKTAGTAIEAALSELCGPEDVITPFREESEGDRKGPGPQNYRIDHPLKPRRKLWRKLLMRPERYYHPSVGYYEHMPAWRVRAYVGEEIWRDYFKFAFVRNPWDRQISQYLYKTKSSGHRRRVSTGSWRARSALMSLAMRFTQSRTAESQSTMWAATKKLVDAGLQDRARACRREA